MRVLITRPPDDAEPLARRLAVGGVASQIEPLLDIRYLASQDVGLGDVQGLLVTSANGVRAFAACSARRDLSVWAVGDASARAASDAGFCDVRSASGDVGALAALLINQADPEAGVLLHVAGTRLAGDLASMLEAGGFRYRRAVLYEARTAEVLSDAARAAFRSGELDGVLLYSPRTAATFVRLIEQHGLQARLSALTAFCLSRAVADKVAGMDWKRVCIAANPQEDDLIDNVFRAAGAM